SDILSTLDSGNKPDSSASEQCEYYNFCKDR
ncbi:CRISPR-associated protein Cas4, partial [Francisella tularensis subsp. holarctica]|nr:CRISPR-associated protein Cas4 [Francisella tularensis subsp. holarctica]